MASLGVEVGDVGIWLIDNQPEVVVSTNVGNGIGKLVLSTEAASISRCKNTCC